MAKTEPNCQQKMTDAISPVLQLNNKRLDSYKLKIIAKIEA